MFKISAAELRNRYASGERYFKKVQLRKVDLSYVDLRGADLSYANLSKAYLNGADLSGANLSGAYYNSSTRFDINFDPIRVGMNKVYPLNTPLEEVKVTTVIEKKRLVFAIAIAEDAA